MIHNNIFLDYLPRDNRGLTEESIERHVEHATNGLDRLLMGGKVSQADYDLNIRRLDNWSTEALMRSAKSIAAAQEA